jgi:hypothetical protein
MSTSIHQFRLVCAGSGGLGIWFVSADWLRWVWCFSQPFQINFWNSRATLQRATTTSASFTLHNPPICHRLTLYVRNSWWRRWTNFEIDSIIHLYRTAQSPHVTRGSSLPRSLTNLKNEKAQVKVAQRRYLNAHCFYSVDEFLMCTDKL